MMWITAPIPADVPSCHYSPLCYGAGKRYVIQFHASRFPDNSERRQQRVVCSRHLARGIDAITSRIDTSPIVRRCS